MEANQKEIAVNEVVRPPVEETEQAVLTKLLGRADSLIRMVRKQLLDAEVAYMTQRTTILQTAKDDIDALERSHVKRVTDLQTTLNRLDALRRG